MLANAKDYHPIQKADTAKPQKTNNGTWLFLKSHVWLLLFVSGWLAMASILVLYIQHKPFRMGSRQSLHPFFPLYQFEVSFAISAFDSAIGACFSCWCGIVAWRTIYILLSTRGTNLDELSRIARAFPPSFRIGRFKSYRGLSLAALVVVCLSLPASYLLTPLLSGSMSWSPVVLNSKPGSEISVPVAGESVGWDFYSHWTEQRFNLVIRSAALASVGNTSCYDGGTFAPRRAFNAARGITINSTLSSITFPMLVVQDIEWIQDYRKSLQPALISSISDLSDKLLSISDTGNPIRRNIPGNMAILKNQVWQPSAIKEKSASVQTPHYSFPKSATIGSEHYVAVLVDRLEKAEGWNSNCTSTSKTFGKLPQIQFLETLQHVNDELVAVTCYAFAKVKLTAGSLQFPHSRVISRGVVEATLDESGALEPQRNYSKLSDPLTKDIFAAMPEVMANMAAMNITNATLWNNIDGYIHGNLVLSFEATWNAMAESFQSNEPQRSDLFLPEQLIVMRILRIPFTAWLTLIACAVISGMMFVAVETHASRNYKVPVDMSDPVLAALRLDASKLYAFLPSLCNSGNVSKSHAQVWLKFSPQEIFHSEKHEHEGQTSWCRFRILQREECSLLREDSERMDQFSV